MAVKHWLQQESKLILVTLAALCLLAVALRLAFLSQPIRTDEAHTFLDSARKPLAEFLFTYDAPNNHIFHTLLVHLSYRLFGDEPWALRLPALVAGVLAVPLAYVAGRLFYNREAGLLAAALVAVSSILIEYSTNARGYTLQIVFFLAALSLAWRLRGRDNRRDWLLLGALTTLSMYTLPTTVYGIGIIGVWLGLSLLLENQGAQRWQRLVPLIVTMLWAGAATLLLYLPAIINSGWRALVANRYVAPTTLENTLSRLPRLAQETWAEWQRDIPVALVALLLAGFVTALVLHWRVVERRYALPLPLVTAVVILAAILVQRVIPYTRVLLFLLPVFFISASGGLAYVLRWATRRSPLVMPAAAAGVALVVGSAVLTNQSILYSNEVRGAQQIAAYLQEVMRPDDLALMTPARGALRYYFYKDGYNMDAVQVWAMRNREVPAERLYVVTQFWQTPLSVMQDASTPLELYSEPRHVGQFELLDLYLTDRAD